MRQRDDSLTLAERMRLAMPALSPAERRLVRRILSGSAAAEVETAASLGAAAGVSTPTVLRCIAKLGFPGYAAFRALVLSEADARRESALAQMGRRAVEEAGSDLCARFLAGSRAALEDTFQRLAAEEVKRGLDLLADSQRKLLFAGGRFSQTLADLLYGHCHLIRPGCALIPFGIQNRKERLMDVGRQHVLTVFDFRRYQADSVDLAREAKRRRAKLILVTDPWMSPIADWADVVLVADVRAASPFDTLVPALAVTETLIAGLYERTETEASARLAGFEALNQGFEWTAS